MTRIAIFGSIFLTILSNLGCDDAGSGTVHGTVAVSECNIEAEDFDLGVDHFFASYFENTLSLQLQHTSQTYTFSDGLYIQVRDVEAVAERLGEPIAITTVPSLSEFKQNGPSLESGDENGYPSTPYNSLIRASLYLYDACPDNPPGFGDGEGTVTFTHIYQPGGSPKIKGSFELEFIDPRTWESAERFGDFAVVSGDFNFTY